MSVEVKPVAFYKWQFNEETKQEDKTLQGYYPFYFLHGIQRNSAIQGYNTAPLCTTPQEAMQKYADKPSRVAPDWWTKIQLGTWHPEDEITE